MAMTGAERQKKFEAARRAEGKMRISVWVWPEYRPIVRDFVRKLMEQPRKERK